jgi:nitroreductase
MAHPQLGLSNDELLSTTRAVRKRLNLERPVPMTVLRECLELAVQAPTGSNAQGWQFVLVTEANKKARIGEWYAQAYSVYRESPIAIHKLHADSPDEALKASQARSASSADYLSEHMGQVPAMLIPCIEGRTDRPEINTSLMQSSLLGSIIPAAWNFMLAARARGLGTAWTTLHLMHEREVSELLGIPYETYMQVALIPIAYTKGTDFSPVYRPPIDSIVHVDTW